MEVWRLPFSADDRRRARRATRVDVTVDARAATSLADADDASAFRSVIGTSARTAEQWARLTFEQAPRALRWFVLAGWRAVLRLQLGPRDSRDHVAGWTIVSNSPRSITMQVRSPLLIAEKVVLVQDSWLTVATFVRYRSRWAQLIWRTVLPVHRRTEPTLVTSAVARSAEFDDDHVVDRGGRGS